MAKEGGGKSSRLHKLLSLLENGSSEDTRKAAGRQIVDIAKNHPEQLSSIAQNVHASLYHKQWDARVAAGEAFGLLAEAFPHHSAHELVKAAGGVAPAHAVGLFGSLLNFNLRTLLERGTALLASGGQEFDLQIDPALTSKQRLEKQKELLKRRLGLDSLPGGLLDTNDLINDEDLDVELMSTPSRGNSAAGATRCASTAGTIKQAAAELLSSMEGLSARERNRLKRKAKSLGRSDSIRAGEGASGGGGGKANPVLSRQASLATLPGQNSTNSSGGNDAAAAAGGVGGAADDDDHWKDVCDGAWPLQWAADQMLVDILDPAWEVRHGAAMGLRELLRVCAGSVAVVAPVADTTSGWMMAGGTGKRRLAQVTQEAGEAAAQANNSWLQEAALLLLCVLALDHFADYGSDQVTAPVRETAAQALALASTGLSAGCTTHVVSLLEQLQQQQEWAVRYGGYLGIKYILATRQDLAAALLPRQLPYLEKGIEDLDDDVCGASAAALAPVCSVLQQQYPDHLHQIAAMVWDRLQELDMLSPASASCLQLLAHLYASPQSSLVTHQLGTLVSRLWPHLHHNITGVRLSAATCLERLITASVEQNAAGWVGPCFGTLVHLTFLRVLLEPDEKVLDAWLNVWRALVSVAKHVPGCIDTVTAPFHIAIDGQQSSPTHHDHSMPLVAALFKLAATPTGQHLPRELLPAECRTGALPATGSVSMSVSPGRRSASPAPEAIGAGPRKRARGSRGAQQAAVQAAIPTSNTDPGVGGNLSGRDHIRHVLCNFSVGSYGEGHTVRMRMSAAQALARLLAEMSVLGAAQAAAHHVLATLTDHSATARQLAALSLLNWMGLSHGVAAEAAAPCQSPEIQAALQKQLAAPNPCHPLTPDSSECYTESRQYYAQLRRELLALVTACMQAGVLIQTPSALPVEQLSTEGVATMLSQVPASQPGTQLYEVQQRVTSMTGSLQAFEQYLHMNTLSSFAAASVRAGQLPPKLNSILQPLMAALRKEHEPLLQAMCGQAVAEFLVLCTARTPSPNDKLVRNLCAMACADALEVPAPVPAGAAGTSNISDQQLAERLASHNQASTSGRGKDIGDDADTAAVAAAVAAEAATGAVSPEAQAARITRLGAEAALSATCKVFKEQLWSQLPSLWLVISGPVAAAATISADINTPVQQVQSVINALQILKVVTPHISAALLPSLDALLPLVVQCTSSVFPGLRIAAARCLAALAKSWLQQTMPAQLRMVVPLLGNAEPAVRLGAVEVVKHLTTAVGDRMAPYVVLLVVPLLRCMSDVSQDVRATASSCFGSLVALLPLAQAMGTPVGLDDQQLQTAAQDSAFLIQLLDNKRAEDFKLPVQPKVTLRPYQQEGINWLAFLKRFGLHGVLADDMGLGKTLQASCILAAALAEADQAANSSAGSSSAVAAAKPPRVCLVVCPSTLVQNWVHEIIKFLDPAVLRPISCMGSPYERATTQKRLDQAWSAHFGSGNASTDAQGAGLPPNVVVISYENLKADIDWITCHRWLYCILDEGHVIKSHKSRISQACRRVVASHRLLLSGTPIQNSVLELWSLFEFLMPGFLGHEKDFNAKYGKALKAAKYSKKGSKESEAGFLAVDALHKQVMPFILRRTKAQVLQDLPPKIVQDIYCDMSPLQAALYEDFQDSQASSDAASALKEAASDGGGGDGGGGGGSGTGHVFQALQYMRKLCSHPALVVDAAVPQHKRAVAKVLTGNENSSITGSAIQSAMQDIRHAPKLVALKDLLVQCGVISGGDSDEEDDNDTMNTGGHRLLVFAQLKSMLDLVERDVLQPHGVSFLRLDGSVDASQRFGVVQKFNSDPTIDVLLLTTSVGGLGLNLTSADTVVFLEHDWNPMKDLQAMDRAHRLGQTRTVNVYRLLMRNTLEEKVMGLQKFKLDVANAVVNQENMSLTDMDTGRLLDLFGSGKEADGAAKEAGKKVPATGLQAMLANMTDLADEKEYESQFNMQSFMSKLGSSKNQE